MMYALGIIALVPWLVLAAFLLHHRAKAKRPATRQRHIEEIERAIRDIEGPARIGYLEIRRIDPDSVFKRSPGRGL